jgi:hypothetical protein
MGRTGNVYKVLVGKPEGRDHSEDLSLDVTLIIECVLEKQSGKPMDWIYLARAGFCEHGNEYIGSIKGGEVLD